MSRWCTWHRRTVVRCVFCVDLTSWLSLAKGRGNLLRVRGQWGLKRGNPGSQLWAPRCEGFGPPTHEHSYDWQLSSIPWVRVGRTTGEDRPNPEGGDQAWHPVPLSCAATLRCFLNVTYWPGITWASRGVVQILSGFHSFGSHSHICSFMLLQGSSSLLITAPSHCTYKGARRGTDLARRKQPILLSPHPHPLYPKPPILRSTCIGRGGLSPLQSAHFLRASTVKLYLIDNAPLSIQFQSWPLLQRSKE